MYCIKCGAKNEDDHQFCVNCGEPLESTEILAQGDGAQAQPSAEPQGASAEARVVPPDPPRSAAAATPPPTPKMKSPPKPRQPLIRDRAKFLRGLLVGGGVFLLLIPVILFFRDISLSFYSALGPGENLLYFVQEVDDSQSAANRRFVELAWVSSKSGRGEVLYSDPDGLVIHDPTSFSGEGFLSPNRDRMAIFEQDAKTMVLLPLDGGRPTTIDFDLEDQANAVGYGFSPDDHYYAVGIVDYQNMADSVVMVYDPEGEAVVEAEGYLFGGFMPNSHEMLVVSAEQAGSSGTSRSEYDLSIMDVRSGELSSSLTNFSIPYWYGQRLPVLGNNMIYYSDEDGLNRIDTRGEEQELVMDTDGAIWALPIPKSNSLAVFDYGDGSDSSAVDLYIYDAGKERKTRIDKYVSTRCGSFIRMGWCVEFSPNGKRILYVVKESNNTMELLLADVDGQNKTRLASGAQGYQFAFSPDGKQVAYVESTSQLQPGRLILTDLLGKKKTRLAEDVWSFQFVEGGRALVYVRVEDLDRNRPESEIARIGVNGKNRKVLVDLDDGLFTLINRH